MPWKFNPKLKVKGPKLGSNWTLLGASPAAIWQGDERNLGLFVVSVFLMMAIVIVSTMFSLRRRGRRFQYEVIGHANI